MNIEHSILFILWNVCILEFLINFMFSHIIRSMACIFNLFAYELTKLYRWQEKSTLYIYNIFCIYTIIIIVMLKWEVDEVTEFLHYYIADTHSTTNKKRKFMI